MKIEKALAFAKAFDEYWNLASILDIYNGDGKFKDWIYLSYF